MTKKKLLGILYSMCRGGEWHFPRIERNWTEWEPVAGFSSNKCLWYNVFEKGDYWSFPPINNDVLLKILKYANNPIPYLHPPLLMHPFPSPATHFGVSWKIETMYTVVGDPYTICICSLSAGMISTVWQSVIFFWVYFYWVFTWVLKAVNNTYSGFLVY